MSCSTRWPPSRSGCPGLPSPSPPGTVRPHARCFRYCDYWASVVHAFDLHVPLRQLEVIGSSLVETSGSEAEDTVSSWGDLEGQPRDDLEEYLTPTVMVPIVPEL